MVIRNDAVPGLDSNVVKFEPALAGHWAIRGENYWGSPLHGAASQSRKLSTTIDKRPARQVTKARIKTGDRKSKFRVMFQ